MSPAFATSLATKSPPSISRARVAEAADYATLAAQADGSDEEALLSLGVDRSEVAVVGQGQNIEESISCALILKRIGVPWVIAKAETDIHGEILTKVGADRIVFPESEAGIQVAHSLEIRHLVAYEPVPDVRCRSHGSPRSAVGQRLLR